MSGRSVITVLAGLSTLLLAGALAATMVDPSRTLQLWESFRENPTELPSFTRGAPVPELGELRSYDGGMRDLAAARREARIDDKHVLLVFGADWCPASQALSEALAHGHVDELLATDFEVVMYDTGPSGSSRARSALRRYSPGANGNIPYAVILDPAHRVVSEGHLSTSPHELLEFLEDQRAQEGTRRVSLPSSSASQRSRRIRVSDQIPNPQGSGPVRLR